MLAVLKVSVSFRFLKQQIAYLCNGTRTRSQIFCIITLLTPSIPGADFLFAHLAALSNSKREIGSSSLFFSSALIFIPKTVG